MAGKGGPGRSDREGLSVVELFKMFPDDAAAERWFEEQRWPDGIRDCPDCGSTRTGPATHKTMPYRCRDCRKYFSVKKGTVMEGSNLGCQKWAVAAYQMVTNLKGVSSMKLHRDLDIRQATAWYMMQRIRESWNENASPFRGPVEADETFVGGLEKNKPAHKKLRAGRGPVGKVVVAGAKDRATGQIAASVVPSTDAATLQPFVVERTAQVRKCSRMTTGRTVACRESSTAPSSTRSASGSTDRPTRTVWSRSGRCSSVGITAQLPMSKGRRPLDGRQVEAAQAP